MSVAAKKLTWDDIKDWPEDAGRTEIVDGELVISPTPATRHQKICTRLGIRLGSFVEQNNSGLFLSSPMHVILAPHLHYEPDLCFIRKQRGGLGPYWMANILFCQERDGHAYYYARLERRNVARIYRRDLGVT